MKKLFKLIKEFFNRRKERQKLKNKLKKIKRNDPFIYK
tara:strand:+ start:663 stop:776 length:114 start_codon:yes stop_codon:yes gene_type:complete